jgi:hypothetical protein
MPNCVVESATHAQAEWYPAPKVLEKVLGGSNRFGERSALSVSDQYCQSLMTKSVGHAMLIALVVVEILWSYSHCPYRAQCVGIL